MAGCVFGYLLAGGLVVTSTSTKAR